MKEIRYLAFKNHEVIPIIRDDSVDNLWRTEDGTVIALANTVNSIDKVDRCGIRFLSLSENHPFTDACRVHDYMFTSDAFQMFHYRHEADAWLQAQFDTVAEEKKSGWLKFQAAIGGFLSKNLSWLFWENDKTKWR